MRSATDPQIGRYPTLCLVGRIYSGATIFLLVILRSADHTTWLGNVYGQSHSFRNFCAAFRSRDLVCVYLICQTSPTWDCDAKGSICALLASSMGQYKFQAHLQDPVFANLSQLFFFFFFFGILDFGFWSTQDRPILVKRLVISKLSINVRPRSPFAQLHSQYLCPPPKLDE